MLIIEVIGIWSLEGTFLDEKILIWVDLEGCLDKTVNFGTEVAIPHVLSSKEYTVPKHYG
jgi:hypothetical protein